MSGRSPTLLICIFPPAYLWWVRSDRRVLILIRFVLKTGVVIAVLYRNFSTLFDIYHNKLHQYLKGSHSNMIDGFRLSLFLCFFNFETYIVTHLILSLYIILNIDGVFSICPSHVPIHR